MAAPLKPWERVGMNYQNSVSFPSNPMAGTLGGESLPTSLGGAVASPLAPNTSPPQLPPRPSQQTSYSTPGFSRPGYGYGGYSSFSNPYSFGGYGGGMYSSPYSNYGQQQVTSAFARQAEESSRPAFESIESIVHAVSSVGMMLDSTFSAVYNSFRAVIGVADNFARLKSQLIQVFSALAFIRTLRYMVRKLLELLRLRPKGEADLEWRKAFNAAAAAASSPDGGPKRSSWPILMFFGIIMGGPYLIWKLISQLSGNENSGWSSGKEDHYVAKANFSFSGQSSEELSFSAGQEIRIAPKELQPKVRGWLLASVDGSTSGLVPANYLSILGRKKGLGSTPPVQTPVTASDTPLAQEAFLQHSTSNRVEADPTGNGKEFDSYFNNVQEQSLVSGVSPSQTNTERAIPEAADILDEAVLS